jgi:hypothetical protein
MSGRLLFPCMFVGVHMGCNKANDNLQMSVKTSIFYSCGTYTEGGCARLTTFPPPPSLTTRAKIRQAVDTMPANVGHGGELGK